VLNVCYEVEYCFVCAGKKWSTYCSGVGHKNKLPVLLLTMSCVYFCASSLPIIFFLFAQVREGTVGHLRSSDGGDKKRTQYGGGNTEKRAFGWSRRLGE
jgi:hypothetical protein